MLNIVFDINYSTIYLGNVNGRKKTIFYKHFIKPCYIKMTGLDQDEHLYLSFTGKKSMLKKT